MSLICRRLRRTLAHTLPRATTLTHHVMTLTPGHAVTCSRMPTTISLAHSDLTHAVSLPLSRSLTHAILLAHVVPLTQGLPFAQGVSLTQGVLESTHFGTLANTHT